jgi:hypothetical protein
MALCVGIEAQNGGEMSDESLICKGLIEIGLKYYPILQGLDRAMSHSDCHLSSAWEFWKKLGPGSSKPNNFALATKPFDFDEIPYEWFSQIGAHDGRNTRGYKIVAQLRNGQIIGPDCKLRFELDHSTKLGGGIKEPGESFRNYLDAKGVKEKDIFAIASFRYDFLPGDVRSKDKPQEFGMRVYLFRPYDFMALKERIIDHLHKEADNGDFIAMAQYLGLKLLPK